MGHDIQLRCCVIDDEPLARRLIESYVEKTPGLSLHASFESGSAAASEIRRGEFDLIFLDIDMPGLTGIELGELVPPSTRIIYITAYDRYALDGFRVNALDYLLKPVSFGEFLRAVTKGFEWKAGVDALRCAAPDNTSATTLSAITVRSEHRIVQIRLETIRYIEVKGDRVIICRTEGLPEVSALMTLRNIEQLLPDKSFMRVHRSYIVNLDHVEVVEKGRIIFDNGFVPVSEPYRDEFLRRIGAG